ncbi:hypothetical protein NE848_13605 [Gramella jeungdoensis]|uniref:Lipoprotein n=1 Tax=Gramella jeungdoensis TaxID=708091 RepID=A0ABT0Z3W9_9FLAO|nr:hypothetical protein [Gramella jeungdoensis]MCM8570424.1 hypothetical protein [Gramella jeungdoensis]
MRRITFCRFLYPFFLVIFLSSCRGEQGDKEKNTTQNKTLNDTSQYIIDVKAIDYAFGMPDEIMSGWVTFRMKNMGKETHFAMVGRKPDSIAVEAFKQEIQEGPKLPYADLMGGPGIHSSGHLSETTIYLEPGHYYIGCHAKTEDGKIHTELGMMRYFKVSKQPSGASKPVADGILNLTNYEIKADLFKNGSKRTLKVEHLDFPMDIQILRLSDSSSFKEAYDYFYDFKDPTKANFIGGAERAETGRTSYISLKFDPGKYVLMSSIYSPWGMELPFEISEEGALSELSSSSDTISQKVEVFIANNNLSFSKKIKSGLTKFDLHIEEGIHALEIFHMKPGEVLTDLEEYEQKNWDYWKTYDSADAKERRALKVPFDPILGSPIYFPVEADYFTAGGTSEFTVELLPGSYIMRCTAQSESSPHWKNGEAYVFQAE